MSKSGSFYSKNLTRNNYLKVAAVMLIIGTIFLVSCAPAAEPAPEAPAAEVPATSEPTAEAVAEESETSEPVELRIMWWGPQPRHDATEAALARYQELHPNVEIVSEYLAFDAYNEKLATQLAAGNAADIFQLPMERYGEYGSRGVLLALDESNPHPVDLSNFDKSMMTSMELDGEVYGIPTGINSGTIFAALDVFEEAGIDVPDHTWTWEEFAVVANQISEAKGEGFWGTMDGGGHREALSSYMRGIGKSTFDEEGNLGFTKEDLIAWFTYWDDLRNSGGAVPAEVMATFQERLEMHMIVQDKAAMDFSGASLGLSLQSATPHELGALTLPSGPVTLGQSVVSGNLWVIYADSPNLAEVGELADFLVNDPEAGVILQQVRGVPASSEIRGILRETADPIDQKMFAFFDLLDENGSPPAPPIPPGGGEVITGIIPRANEAVAFGQLTIEEAVDQVFTEAEKALSE